MLDSVCVALVPGAVFNGRYRIARSLSAGGMGAVYEVFDLRIDAPRALKVMLPSLLEDPEFRERFIREAKFTGSIQSDHIVRVSDAAVDDATGMPFIVMELLEGEELAKLATRRWPMPHAEVVSYLVQTALGLEKAHAKGIVHRDLKPQNLFVTTRDDGTPSVKILDFGIAKAMAQGADAKSTRPIGTPQYMAPEQVRGDGSTGPRADVYALAHVAYTLLVGEPYWTEEAKASDALFLLWGKIVAGPEERPVTRAERRRDVRLPAAFDAWFFKAAAASPADRFDRATACITALADALSVRPPMPSAAWLEIAAGAAPAPVGPGQDSSSKTSDRLDRRGPGDGRTMHALASKVAPQRARRPHLAVASAAAAAVVTATVAAFVFLRLPPDAPVPAAPAAPAPAGTSTAPPATAEVPTSTPSATAPAPAVSASKPAAPIPTLAPRPRPSPSARLPGKPKPMPTGSPKAKGDTID